MKKLFVFFGIVFFVGSSLMMSGAYAATLYYDVKVLNTVLRSDGSINIKFIPGETEDDLAALQEGQKLYQATINGDSPSANKFLAVILTSVALVLKFQSELNMNQLLSLRNW